MEKHICTGSVLRQENYFINHYLCVSNQKVISGFSIGKMQVYLLCKLLSTHDVQSLVSFHKKLSVEYFRCPQLKITIIMQSAWTINNEINQNKLHTDSIKQCWNKASGKKKNHKALCLADESVSSSLVTRSGTVINCQKASSVIHPS